jgi:hypothetical protein
MLAKPLTLKRSLPLLFVALLLVLLFSALGRVVYPPGFFRTTYRRGQLAQRLLFTCGYLACWTALPTGLTLSRRHGLSMLFSNPLVEPGFWAPRKARVWCVISIDFRRAAFITQTSASVFALAGWASRTAVPGCVMRWLSSRADGIAVLLLSPGWACHILPIR